MWQVESDFFSRGTRCAGTLYLPDADNPPVVVMAHGFAAEKAFRLPAFAEKFTDCRAALEAARRIKNARMVSFPVGHFEAYVGDTFEKVVEIEGEFLREILI